MTHGIYDADGKIRCTASPGSGFVGAYAPDGSRYVTVAPGGIFVGCYAPDGSLYVTDATGSTSIGLYAPDGSVRVTTGNDLNGALRISGFSFAATEENYLTADTLTWVTLARSGHAMMYDSTGKLTWAPNNCLTYSEQFDNAAWGKALSGEITVTSNAATAPDGTTTADLCVAKNAANGYHIIRQASGTTTADTYIYSCYAKATDLAVYNQISFREDYAAGTYASFNLTTGVTTTVTGTAGMTAVPGYSGWYLCWWKASRPASHGIGIYIHPTTYNPVTTAPPSNNYVGDGVNGFYLWGANIERVTYESSPRTYNATTSDIYYGPRFDYNPATLAKRGLLVEGSRTNLLTNSNGFGSWSTDATPITRVQNVTGPDGVSNSAWSLTDASAVAASYVYVIGAAIGSQDAGTYTYSVFIKKTTGATHFPCLSVVSTGLASRAGVNINTNTGALAVWTTYTGTYSTILTSSARVVEETADFYRVALTYTIPSITQLSHVLVVANRTSLDTEGVADNAAQGTTVVYGAQLEAGSFATSYIPTTTVALPRAADGLTAALYTSDDVTMHYRNVSDLTQATKLLTPFSTVSSENNIWVEKFVLNTRITTDNLLVSPGDHNISPWSKVGILSVTGGQADRLDGTTAEVFVEDSNNSGHSIAQDNIDVPTTRLIATLYAKQKAGSNAARRLEMEIATAVTRTNGVYIRFDEAGGNLQSGVFGSGWTINSATVTADDNGFYKAVLDFNLNEASVRMHLESRDDSSGTYLGDGASGWVIDDHSLIGVFAAGDTTDDILLEDGSFLLLESGDKLLLE